MLPWRTHPTGKHSYVHALYMSCECACVRFLTSQECSPYRDSMCLTIDKPFFTAFICGRCLNNVHDQADYSSCIEIGGRQMEADNP